VPWNTLRALDESLDAVRREFGALIAAVDDGNTRKEPVASPFLHDAPGRYVDQLPVRLANHGRVHIRQSGI